MQKYFCVHVLFNISSSNQIKFTDLICLLILNKSYWSLKWAFWSTQLQKEINIHKPGPAILVNLLDHT